MTQSSPPNNIYSEEYVLSNILKNSRCADRVIPLLGSTPDRFFDETNAAIYERIVEHNLKGKPCSASALYSFFESELITGNGVDLLRHLATECGESGANIEYHCDQITQAYVKRQMIDSCRNLAKRAMQDGDVASILDDAQSSVFAMSQSVHKNDSKSIDELAKEANQDIHDAKERKGERLGVPTNIKQLNDLLGGGFQEEDFVIVAARPSVGKTAFMLNLAHYASLDFEYPVFFVSLEMSGKALATRLMGINQRLPLQEIRNGEISSAILPRVDTATTNLMGAKLEVDYSPAQSIWKIRSEARRHQSKHGKGIIFVDYLQLIRNDGVRSGKKRYEEIGEISRGLKQLARELKCPVVCACQINRAADSESNGYKMLAHLRESGDIEQDADVVIVLSRTVDKSDESSDEYSSNVLQLTLAKNRNGPTGQMELYFHRNTQQINTLAEEGEKAKSTSYDYAERIEDYEENDDLF